MRSRKMATLFLYPENNSDIEVVNMMRSSPNECNLYPI